jgi:hypothetical protein
MSNMEIDWFQHYAQKTGMVLDKKAFENNLKTDKLYIQLLKNISSPTPKSLNVVAVSQELFFQWHIMVFVSSQSIIIKRFWMLRSKVRKILDYPEKSNLFTQIF